MFKKTRQKRISSRKSLLGLEGFRRFWGSLVLPLKKRCKDHCVLLLLKLQYVYCKHLSKLSLNLGCHEEDSTSIYMTGTWLVHVEKNTVYTSCVPLSLLYVSARWHISIDLCAKWTSFCCNTLILFFFFLLNFLELTEEKKNIYSLRDIPSLLHWFVHMPIFLTDFVFTKKRKKRTKNIYMYGEIHIKSLITILREIIKKKLLLPTGSAMSSIGNLLCAAHVNSSRACHSLGEETRGEREASDLSKRSSSTLYLTPLSLNTLH